VTDQHSSRRGAKSVLDSGVRLPMTAYQYLTFHPGSLGSSVFTSPFTLDPKGLGIHGYGGASFPSGMKATKAIVTRP